MPAAPAPPAPVFDRPGGKAKGTNPLAWLQGHRNAALGGGAVAVAGFALYKRSHPSSSAAAAPTTDAGTATDPTSTYSSDSVDQYNALASSISQLGDANDALGGQISTLTARNTALTASDTVLTAAQAAEAAQNKSLLAKITALSKAVVLKQPGTTVVRKPVKVPAAAPKINPGGTIKIVKGKAAPVAKGKPIKAAVKR